MCGRANNKAVIHACVACDANWMPNYFGEFPPLDFLCVPMNNFLAFRYFGWMLMLNYLYFFFEGFFLIWNERTKMRRISFSFIVTQWFVMLLLFTRCCTVFSVLCVDIVEGYPLRSIFSIRAWNCARVHTNNVDFCFSQEARALSVYVCV